MANEGETIPVPRDLAEARERIATLRQQQQSALALAQQRIASLEQRLVYAERRTLLLQHEIDVLLRRVFGRRSEKFTQTSAS